MRGDEEVESRHDLAGLPFESQLVDEELDAGGDIERRSLLRRALWLAGGAVGASLLVPIRSLGPAPGRALLRTRWSDGVQVMTRDGRVVHADDVPADGLLTVFPANGLGAADAQVVLVRVAESLLRPAAG